MHKEPREAIDILLNHAGHIVDDDLRCILDTLRPYSGLVEEDFIEIMTSLISLYDEFSTGERLHRELIAACWDLGQRIRLLAIDDGSTLRRIVPMIELLRLRRWVYCIENYCLQAIRPLKVAPCLASFIDYLEHEHCIYPEKYQHFLPFLESLQETIDVEDQQHIESIKNAIQKIKLTLPRQSHVDSRTVP